MKEDDSEQAAEEARRAEDLRDSELTQYLRAIGAKSLAAELGDLRFRNRVVEAQRVLEAYDSGLAYEEALHDTIDQRLLANHTALFDKSQSYMNFVVTLGYAGFFAIWNFIKDLMNPWDMKLVALLLGASLFLFITWTLVTMVAGMRATTRSANAIHATHDDREAMLEAIKCVDHQNRVTGLRLQRFWLPTFGLTVALAFIAGLVLLVLLAADVLDWPFSVHGLFYGE